MATIDIELSLVRRFHALCEPYEARPSITRRNTLPTLIRFLESNDRETRRLSLQSIYLLVQHPSCIEVLARNDKLHESLDSLQHDARYDDPELCDLAARTLHYVDTYRLEQAEIEFGSRVAADELGEGRQRSEHGMLGMPTSHASFAHDSFIKEIYSVENSSDGGSHVAGSAAETGSVACQAKLCSSVDHSTGTKSRLRSASFSSISATKSDCGGGDTYERTPEYNTTCNLTRRDNMRSDHRLSSSIFDTPQQRGVHENKSEGCSTNSFARRPSVAPTRESPLLVTMDVPALNARSDTTLLERVLQDARGVVSYNILASSHQIRVFMNAHTEKALQESLRNVGYANMIINIEQMTVASDCYNPANYSHNGSFASNDAVNSNIFANNIHTSHVSSSERTYFDKENEMPSYVQSVKSFASGLYGALTVFGEPKDQTIAPPSGQTRSLQDKSLNTTSARIVKAFQRWW